MKICDEICDKSLIENCIFFISHLSFFTSLLTLVLTWNEIESSGVMATSSSAPIWIRFWCKMCDCLMNEMIWLDEINWVR